MNNAVALHYRPRSTAININNVGYIDPAGLRELWFHVGTACNLACPFCLEGSQPGDNRLQAMKRADVIPFINEALTLGVEQLSFTGGEPFVMKEFPAILDYASRHRPCLVLTNATDPLLRRIDEVIPLLGNPHLVSFRVSLDVPDATQHDRGRGRGSFVKAMEGMRLLHRLGFEVSVARQMHSSENREQVEADYQRIFSEHDLPENLSIVAFPDFYPPGATVDVPAVTRDCMTRYQTEETRAQFMCGFSRMVVKQNGRMRVYACTLVDDDPEYDLGETLTASLQRVYLHHQRCFSCFKYGASCSELKK